MNRITIEQLFRTWGQSQRCLPEHTEALRARLLAHAELPPRAVKSAPRIGRTWLLPVLSTVCALLLFVLIPGHKQQVVQTFSQTTALVGGQPSATQSEERAVMSSAPHAFSKSAGMSLSAPMQDEGVVSLPAKAPAVSDTRELLKVNYSASVQTRSVSKAGERLEVLVRGFGGRVDSARYSSGSGYLSFVVPQEKLPQFRLALQEAFGGERFVLEHTDSENMLSQKQGIEKDQARISGRIMELRARLQSLESDHKAKLAALEAELRQNKSEQASIIKMERLHPEQSTAFEARLEALRLAARDIGSKLASEQSAFSAQQSSLTTEITAAEQTVKNLGEQTSELLQEVATVSGMVDLEHIDLLSFLNAYVYFRWSLPVLLLICALFYTLRTKRNRLFIP